MIGAALAYLPLPASPRPTLSRPRTRRINASPFSRQPRLHPKPRQGVKNRAPRYALGRTLKTHANPPGITPVAAEAAVWCSVAAERATARAARLGAEGTIPTIGGRAPINSKYAGQIHPSGVEFTEQGFPNFRPYSQAEVEIPNLTGKYSIDSQLANEAMGFPSTPKGYVWHHVEDGATMQLIPQGVHNSVRHTGGAAVIRNGGFD